MKKNESHHVHRTASIALALMISAWGGPAEAGGGAHADHAPRHGGILMMKGDLHYEVVVDFEGGVAIYFSDAHRRPLTADQVKSAAITVMRGEEEGETILLRAGEGGSWVGAGQRIDGSEATVRVSFSMFGDERPYSIDIAVERERRVAHHHHHHHH